MIKRPAKAGRFLRLGTWGTSSTVCGDEQSAHFLAFSVRSRSPFPKGEGEARRWRAGIIICPFGAEGSGLAIGKMNIGGRNRLRGMGCRGRQPLRSRGEHRWTRADERRWAGTGCPAAEGGVVSCPLRARKGARWPWADEMGLVGTFSL